MIRQLKLRMIVLVLAGLLLASAGLVFAINWMNWRDLNTQADQVLTMLAENNGQRPMVIFGAEMDAFPRPEEWEEGMTPPPIPGGKEERTRLENTYHGQNRDGSRNNSARLMNAANLSNFYTISLNEAGEVTGWTSERADLYNDDTMADLAAAALAAGGESGRVGTQFFRLIGQDKGKMLIVVDRSMEIENAQSVFRLTALVAVAEDALLSLGAIWLIRRMVRPVDEAMEKQKQFVWDASHELKTPLAVISANAEALEAEAGPSRPLEFIRSEVQRTDKLIQSLLTLARMEKGTVQAVHQRFDLSHALLEVALPFESAVFEAGKEMEMDIPDGVEYVGDEEMIKQLLVILLSNAEKYSDPGGRIRISLEEKGDKRFIRVFNTGPAIPPEAQEKIFDRFYRVDSSHNREIEGNGLGLAIARSITEAHKGKITVQSREGEGTAFTVSL